MDTFYLYCLGGSLLTGLLIHSFTQITGTGLRKDHTLVHDSRMMTTKEMWKLGQRRKEEELEDREELKITVPNKDVTISIGRGYQGLFKSLHYL